MQQNFDGMENSCRGRAPGAALSGGAERGGGFFFGTRENASPSPFPKKEREREEKRGKKNIH